MKISYFAIYLLTSLTMMGCGGGGDSSSPSPTPPSPTPINQSPTANAGPDVQGDEGSSIVINGSASDSDGTISSYQWTQVSGPQVNANFTNTATPDVLLPLVDSDSIAVLRLTVTDDDGAESSDDVQITIINLTGGNTSPVVDAGDDITVSSGDNVSLIGEASDSDGSIVNYQWTQLSGSQVTINDSDSANASFTAPSVESDTTLSFRLTVTDNGGLTSQDTVNITIQPPTSGGSVGTLLWEYVLQERLAYGLSIDDDGSLYTCYQVENESRFALQKISSDGDLVWVTAEDCFLQTALSDSNIVFMHTPDDDVLAINKVTGTIEWTAENFSRGYTTFNPAVAVLSNGDVVLHGNNLGVHSYNISGELLWSTGFQATRGVGALSATSNGLVLFADLDAVLAIKDGTILWRTPLSGIDILRAHPDGVIAMTSDSRQVYMLDWANGEQKWTFNDDESGSGFVVENGIVISEDKSIYLYTTRLNKINPTNGAVENSVELVSGANFGENLTEPTPGLLLVQDSSDGYLVNPQGEIVELDDFSYRYTRSSNSDYRPSLMNYWVTESDLTYTVSKIIDPSDPNYNRFILKVFSGRDQASNAVYGEIAGNLKRQNTVDIDVSVSSNSYNISSNGLLLKAGAPDVVFSNGSVNPDNYNPAYTFESSAEFSGSFSLSSESVDTYAYIVNAQNGQVLLENDDSDNSTNSRISFNAQPGKYVAVASASQDGFGDLKIEMTFDDETEIDVKELRTDNKLNPGNSSVNPSSLTVQQDTFYVVNNVTENPELAVVDPSNPVVGSGESAQFTKEDFTYSTVRYTYTSCFDGGDSKIQFQTSSGQVTERNLASRSNTIYTTGGITDIGAPELSSTLIMTSVRLVTEVSESPPLAPGQGPQCEIDDFESDWVLYESTLDAKHILSQDGLENLMSNEHGVVSTSNHFLDEENNFYGMYQGDNGDSFQLNVPNENLADFETLLESFRVDPNFNPGDGTQPADCESAWSGPDDPQFSPQCALACLYAGAGVEEGRAASCQILQNADPSYPGFCSACN